MNWILLYNTAWDFAKDIHYPLIDDYVLTSDHQHLNEAIAIIFHMPTLSREDRMLINPQKKAGQLWVFMSMECEVHYEWQYTKEILSLFDLQMTYKIDSDIPTPYIYPQYRESMLRKPEIKTGLVNAFISGDFDRSNRVKYLQELMNYIEVHSYGKTLNNKKIEHDEGIKSKEKIISSYKFTLAFENAIARDYVTEKLFQPLIAGSVPIYLGAPNAEAFAPGEHCYININDFPSAKDLAKYIIKLDHDPAKYEEYLTWKNQPLRNEFRLKAEIQLEDQFIRLSKKLKSLKNSH